MTVPLPSPTTEPPTRRRSSFRRDRVPLSTDVPAGVAFVLVEGVLLLWLAFSAGMAAWGSGGSTARADAATLAEISRAEYLLIGVLMVAVGAALLRAAWTAGIQVVVAVLLTVMVVATQHGYDQRHALAEGAPGLGSTPNDQTAGAIVKDLNADLNSGFLSPGQTYGGPFTEGTVVNQVELHGGVVLSLASQPASAQPSTAQPAGGGLPSTEVSVMVGMTGPNTPSCYRYSFTVAHDSTQVRPMSCPGGATVELGRTLLNQPNAGYQRADAPNAYPVTVAGVRSLLRQRVGAQVAALPFVTATSSSAGTAVLAAAVRVHGVCDFVRVGTSTTVSSWVDFWPAPVDDQSTCDATRALAAATLYGADPAQEG